MISSKFPIIVMPMNGVSTTELAIAVHNAGAFPSISVFNYYSEGRISIKKLTNEFLKFQDKTGSSNILVSMHWEELLHPAVLDMLINCKIFSIELFVRPISHNSWPVLIDYIKKLRNENFKIIFKTTGMVPISEFDALVIKGPLGAGRSFSNTTDLENAFDKLKEKLPDSCLIPSGGIGCSEQVKYYISRGAAAVGIGTLIAASEESCVSIETKQKIINSTSSDITSIGPLNCRGLLFSKLENDDDNNSKSLREGIKGTTQGCIYVGNGIDHIKKIMPVKNIIELLVQDVI